MMNCQNETGDQSSKNSAHTVRKKNCCLYCRNAYVNIAKHLENAHKDEEDVKKFSILPKGSRDRREIIDIIRKKGNFESNQYISKMIPTRNPRKGCQVEYTPCPRCRGYYSKNSLIKHYRKCNKEFVKQDRTVVIQGRRLACTLHPNASDVLRNEIFPRLRQDHVYNIIRLDSLVISYGNKLCLKYRKHHLQKMIRAELRLIGRFLLTLKTVNNNVSDFMSIFNPVYYNDVIQTVNILAKIRDDDNKFDVPANATSLGIMLKKVGKHLKSYLIQRNCNDKIPTVENFLHLLHEDYGASINKTAVISQMAKKRKKTNQLPLKHDIQNLYNYTSTNKDFYYEKLKSATFNYDMWQNLASYTLISIQVFNRRRAGETERMELEDVKNYQHIDIQKDKDIFDSLDVEDQEISKEFVRIPIVGKLDRNVGSIVDIKTLKCLQLIIELRSLAGVHSSNTYVFGLPSNDPIRKKHLDACKFMREYANKCGASQPELLRGTLLRKHLATEAAILGLNSNEVSDIATHLGHEEKIHRDYYRLPVATREITKMSSLLRKSLIPTTSQASVSSASTSTATSNEDHYLTTLRPYVKVVRLESSNLFSNQQEEQTFDEPEIESVNSECESPQSTKKVGKKNAEQKATKRTWTTPEKSIVRHIYAENFQNKKLPSFTSCKETVAKYGDLKGRTPKQLYAWINNEINKGKECESKSKSKIQRRSWCTPEREIIKTVFEKNIRNLILPSISACEAVIKNTIVLNSRTVDQVYAYVNNIIQKEKTTVNATTEEIDVTPRQEHSVKKIFSTHINDTIIPSTEDCVNAILKTKTLKECSVSSIKNIVSKEIKRRTF